MFALFDSAPLGGIGYCFRVGWHPAGLPPHGIHWQRFCTHYYFFDSAPLGGIGYCFRVGWHPAGLPPHGIHWQRFCTHYYFFDSAPLGGIGYWLELRSSGLANTSTSAPNVCLSEPSLFGDADLKASAGAPRQSRSRQHPIPLAVRSRSYTKRALPCKREPWSAKPCLLPSERAMPVS